MSSYLLLLVTIVGFLNANEIIGGKKSIIPRHASEKGTLYHIKEPDELFKRSKVGSTFDSSAFHQLENFLLKSAEEIELSSKKSEIEDQKEVETIAEDNLENDELKSAGKEEKGKENAVAKDNVETKENIVNDERKKSKVSKNESGKDAEGEKSEKTEKKPNKELNGKNNNDNNNGEKKEGKKTKKDVLIKKEPKVKEKTKDENAMKRDKTSKNKPEDDDAEYGR